MKILGVGGGSGGHVTPVLAVINELSALDSKLEARFVTDTLFAATATDVLSHSSVPVVVRKIIAGKFRRYYGVSWKTQARDLETIAHNVKDLFRIAVGIIQSFWLLISWRPDVVFTKGGFVCVPVAFAAWCLRIPIVMHDSDAHPGLANRIVSRWARAIATGAELKHYSYPSKISKYTGTPIDASFVPYDAAQIKAARSAIGMVDPSRKLITVTGGGLGARRLNDAMIAIGDKLVAAGASVYHISGKLDFEQVQQAAPESAHYQVVPFISDGMAKVFGAADIVVTRAGATSLLEVAAMKKAAVIVPNAMLTGGHQTKNAMIYLEAKAAVVVAEDEYDERLLSSLLTLLSDDELRTVLGSRIEELARPQAAKDVAQMILKAGTSHGAQV